MPEPGGAIYAPEFPKELHWIGTEPIKWRDLFDRKVVLVDFWDYTCVNCLRTLPYLAEWNSRYSDKGLATIGVHSPEFSFAADDKTVESAVDRLGIEYPVVVDSAYEIWQLYGNRGWPAKYLWDDKGKLVWFHYGEGEYEATERAIQKALHDLNPSLELPGTMKPVRDTDQPDAACIQPTPELYLGSARDQPPVPIKRNGRWNIADDYSEVVEPEAEIEVRYEAAGVNIVLAPPDETGAAVDVALDGVKISTLDVSEPRMYELVDGTEHEAHHLTLHFRTPGTRAYAFTFTPGCADKLKP